LNKTGRVDFIIIIFLVIVITLLHYFTPFDKWGFHEFYRRLYYIPIILSAFRFRLKGGIITAVAVSTLYAPHLLLYWGSLNIDILNQFLEIVLFITVGLITGFLVEKRDNQQKLLKHQIIKLTELENYTNNILNSIVNGVIAVDNDGKITSFNEGALNLFNFNRNDVKGQPIEEVFEHDRIKKWINKVLATDEVLREETKIKQIPVKLHIYPLKTPERKTKGVVLVCEDLAEIKELEEQVRRAERLSAVGEFASGVAHEIRNPLAIIKTVSETLKDEAKRNNEIKEAINIINEEIDRADTVIKELLDFARPHKARKENFILNDLLKELMLLTRKYAKQHEVVIQADIPKKQINVYGDPEKIKQALINVILNGIQAMPRGGILDINLKLQGNEVIINIKDTGVGIDEEHKEKIFNPFFTTKDEGTGLGLTITYKIIEEHGGKIQVKSKKREGSLFIITLPIRSEKGLENSGG